MKIEIYKKLVVFTVMLLLLFATPYLGQAAPPTQQPPADLSATALVGQLNQLAGSNVNISYHNETGKLNYIGASPSSPIAQPAMAAAISAANISPEIAARGFMADYGTLFGLENPNSNLTVMKIKTVDNSRSFVRFQQNYKGIPIIGGEIIVQTGTGSNIISANGEALPGLNIGTNPIITAETARQTALAKVSKDYGFSIADLTASQPELWIYNPILMGGPGVQIDTLVWRMEVAPNGLYPINEFVLVDATMGVVVLHFNQTPTAKNRKTYTANNATTLPGTLVCDESDPTCVSGDSHAAAAHNYAGDTYDFYLNEHGRDSIDNAGMAIISTVHYDSNYANAFWEGTQMVYGDANGFPLADDVVAHELTHGVTNSESNLFYFYQSGAINESLSDVWGEFVDQTNGKGTDTAAVRWQMGEDVTGTGGGAIRNMKDPTIFNNADKMTSPIYYCEQSDLSSGGGDNGGVHLNSGVNNKATYLMTDGDFFNGITTTGIGYAKVADLYYEVQTNMLTSAADYLDLYNGLTQACTNLGYSAGECQSVQNALTATEMNQQPTSCAATSAPICDTGSPINLFFDDIESGSTNWTPKSIDGSSTLYWFVPQTSSNIGFANPYATSGQGNIWGFDQDVTSDTALEMNKDITLPAKALMHFDHSFGFEANSAGTVGYDGGVVEYSTNSGTSWNSAASLFTQNGYNGILEATNPFGAVPAFGADSLGYVSSRLDLSSLAGQNVRFRFRIGTDNFTQDFGWFIDNVRIYTCAVGNTAPTFLSSGLPSQRVSTNSNSTNSINLWNYVSDYESQDSSLTFSLINTGTLNSKAGISIINNHFIAINPNPNWIGITDVTVQAKDTGNLTSSSNFRVTVGAGVYLPAILKNN